MFPSSLHKNIRELDRQISLLETECENMDVDKDENSSRGKITSEFVNKLFVTDSIRSACSSHLTKKCLDSSQTTPKIYPPSFVPVKLLNETGDENFKSKAIIQESSKNILNSIEGKTANLINGKGSEKREDNYSEETEKDEETLDQSMQMKVLNGNTGERRDLKASQRVNAPRLGESRKSCCKSSISSTKEASESSHDNWSVCGKNCSWNQKHSDRRKKSKERVKNERVSQKFLGDRRKGQEGKQPNKSSEIIIKSKSQVSSERSRSVENPDEEERKSVYWNGELSGGEWLREKEFVASCPAQILSMRRPRSNRTKKKFLDETLFDEDLEKSLDEKEIQCMLWNEDNSEYLINLNQSIRALYYLIGELRKKSSQDKTNDVLNDMQNTLMKIGGMKAANALYNSYNSYNSLKVQKLELETEETDLDFQKIFFGVKKFCQELSDEKSTLYEELEDKKRLIANMKNKEKEYLTLISSLKFNLEKTKEQAEEGARAMIDLKVAQSKLQEETKVIEALKKSHGKMQEIVENYVLANDKLRTQIKIAKLESHKYNALLAGKEVEIKKYKEEMELFQRQISEQLKLLRSKASGNEIDNAIEAITNQAKIPSQMDDDTFPSQTTFGRSDFNEPFSISSGKSSLASLWTQNHSQQHELMANLLKEVESKEAGTESGSAKLSGGYYNSIYQMTEVEVNTRDTGFKSCKSEDSDDYDWKSPTNRTKSDKESKKLENELEKVLVNSNALTTNISSLLKEAGMKGLEKVWRSSEKLCNSSEDTLVTTTSDNSSGCCQNV